MNESTRRALEAIERVEAALERAADQPHVDETWRLRESEHALPEFRQAPPRTKSQRKPPERARDESVTHAFIERRLEQFAQMLGEECGTADRRLRDEIGQLRAEISVLRALLQAANETARLRSELAELKNARDSAVLDLPSLPLRPMSGH